MFLLRRRTEGTLNFLLWGLGSLLATKSKRYLLPIALHLILYFLVAASPAGVLLLWLLLMVPGTAFFTIEGLRPAARGGLSLRLTASEHDVCVNCGVKLEKRVKFCPECGHSQA